MVVVAGTTWYNPVVTAAGWRVFHPSGKILYQNLEIVVPWPWIADIEQVNSESYAAPQGVQLKRHSGTLGRPGPVETIFIDTISPDPHTTSVAQIQKWISSFEGSHPGADFSGSQQVSHAECIVAHPSISPPERVATCISVADGWVANFEGTQSQLRTFMQVVNSLKHR